MQQLQFIFLLYLNKFYKKIYKINVINIHIKWFSFDEKFFDFCLINVYILKAFV